MYLEASAGGWLDVCPMLKDGGSCSHVCCQWEHALHIQALISVLALALLCLPASNEYQLNSFILAQPEKALRFS